MKNETKDKLKVFFRITIFILLIVVILLVVLRIIYRKSTIKDVDIVENELVYNPNLFSEADKFENERFALEKSDIEGMTNLDKKNAGLAPYDGSDSDMDGLTDKEEIEVYGSDPLKTSTSGDLYSDGYKIENGLELDKVYDDSFVTYMFEIPDEFTLYPSSASDNVTEIIPYSVGEHNAYKAYFINGYSGNSIDINISDICSKYNVKASKLGCYISDIGNANATINCKFSVKEDILSLTNEFDANNGYIIYITLKKNIATKPMRFFLGDELAEEIADTNVIGDMPTYKGHAANAEDGIVVMILPITYPVLGNGIKPVVFYNSIDDGEIDQRLIERLHNQTRYLLATKEVDIDLRKSSIVKIINLYDKLEGICGGFFNGKHDSASHNALFSYSLLSEYEASLPDLEVATNFSTNSGFDIVEDTLPFPNFGTVISEGGNCAGISTLIAKVYNTGTNPSSGEGIYSDIKWDISKDPENKTLMDPGLSDYKDSNFRKKHLGLAGLISWDLSDGEKEFLKMIGTYFLDANIEATTNCPYVYTSNYTGYSFVNLRNVCYENLSKKTLVLGMYDNNLGGHMVNIYGFHDNIDTDGTFSIDIYDNNYPGAKSAGLKVDIIPEPGGTFSFSYITPYENSFSSFNTEKYNFVILDEDYNILFGSNADILNKIRPATQSEIREYELKKELEKEWYE